MRKSANPDILDVVPWSYGFAHSWVLRWLLESDFAPAVVAEIGPLSNGGAQRVSGLERETRVGASRADLAFRTVGTDGDRYVAVETKVSDPLKEKQIRDYEAEDYLAVLYLPGLTGFLIEENPHFSREVRLMGQALSGALKRAGGELPPLIAKYFAAVDAKAHAFKAATEARGRLGTTLSDEHGEEKALLDVAWLRLLVAALRNTAVAVEQSPLRDERSDRGLFWSDAAQPAPLAGNGAEFYIDVLAPKQTERRVVAIKGGWTREVLSELFRLAQEHGAPQGPGGWKLANKRFTGDTKTLWSADVTDTNPVDAAQVAIAAKTWIDVVATSG